MWKLGIELVLCVVKSEAKACDHYYNFFYEVKKQRYSYFNEWNTHYLTFAAVKIFLYQGCNIITVISLSISIYSCDGKTGFSVSSVSHDPSEIRLICWFDAQEIVNLINVENIFGETVILFMNVKCKRAEVVWNRNLSVILCMSLLSILINLLCPC